MWCKADPEEDTFDMARLVCSGQRGKTLVGGVRADKILLVLNEFRYGVKGERGLRDS